MSNSFYTFRFILRTVTPADVAGVFKLINVLAEYEGGSHLVTNTEEQLLEDFFGENPLCSCITVIEKKTNEIAGIALYYYCYSTWVGKCLYLEDLVMLPKYRGKGLGFGVFQCISYIAKVLVYFILRLLTAREYSGCVLTGMIQESNFTGK